MALAVIDLESLLGSWHPGEILIELFLIAIIGVFAFLFAKAFNRFMRRIRDGRGPWRKSLLQAAPVARFSILLLVAAAIGTVIFQFSTIVLVLVLVAIAISFGIGGVGVVRNLLAGLVLALQRPFAVGDRINVNGIEGEVVHTGEVSTILRSADGARLEVPNHHFIDGVVINSALHDVGAPVEVSIPLPHTIDLTAARMVGQRAAIVSKYASVRRRPDVMVTHLENGQIALLLRVFAFEARYAGQLRSEVTELIEEGLQLGKKWAARRASGTNTESS